DLLEAEIDDLLAGLLEKIVRGANDQLEILTFFRSGTRGAVCTRVEGGLVEDPLGGGIEESDERFCHHLTVEPEMHAGDGGVDYFVEISERSVTAFDACWKEFGERQMRKGENKGVGGFFTATVEERGEQFAICETQAAEWRTKVYFPALFFDGGAATVVKFAEGDSGNAHAVASFIRKNCFPENVDAVAGVDAVQFFGEGAD